MRPAAVFLGLLLADSSGRPGAADLSRFDFLRSFGPVRASSLSPAGDRVAVYSGNAVKLVDVREGKEVFILSGHTAQIHDSGWSRDGRILATSGYDGTVRIWQVATGRELARLQSPHAGYT
jgi:WD40 repeat protein